MTQRAFAGDRDGDAATAPRTQHAQRRRLTRVLLAEEKHLDAVLRPLLLAEQAEERGMATLKKEGVVPENMEFLRSLDMRYRGQFYEIEVPVSNGQITRASVEEVVERFHLLHQELYAFSVEDKPTEMMNYKLVAVGRIEKPQLEPMQSDGADPSRALGPPRSVYFSNVKDFLETQIYDGNGIRAGDRITGPAIIEEPFTTIAVPPDFNCEVDHYGNYVMEVPL